MKKLISISAFVLMMVIVFNCKRTDLEPNETKVGINVMPFHPWDPVWSRMAADNPNGFQGASPSVFTRSFGLRTTMDNVKLTGGGSYDMEVFNNLQIHAETGGLQIQLGYWRNANTTQPLNEYHTSIVNMPLPTVINGFAPGWKTGKQSTYKIYKVFNYTADSVAIPTTRWRTNIDGTDILEFETFDTASYAYAQTCGTGIFTTGTGKFPTVNWSSALEITTNGKDYFQVLSARNIYCASKVGIKSDSKGTLVTGTNITKPSCGILFW